MLDGKSIDSLKRELQSFFSDGLLTVVGSGLSCAEGLPGMGALAERLSVTIPESIASKQDQDTWAAIDAQLAMGVNLESALQSADIGEQLEAAIVSATADYIEIEEKRVLSSVVCGDRALRLSRLLPYFSQSGTNTSIVTTNYDRLVEASCEASGFHVDTLFTGSYMGRVDPSASRWAACRGFVSTQRPLRVRPRWAPRVRVYKPHGSLDWYATATGDPVQCSASLNARRLMITPGRNKYFAGYDQPFDRQREEANRAIDSSQRYLVVGYGFNDPHLQTHLCKEIAAGKPTLVLNRSLSSNGQDAMNANSAGIALVDDTDNPGMNTVVVRAGSATIWSGVSVWDIDGFVNEVMS